MLSFVKLTAAGNDFLLLDGREGLPERPDHLARSLCARRLSLGADGLIVVETTGCLPSLGVTHFEPDGARTFCLNAVRGAAAWLVATGQHPVDDPIVLRTDAGDLDVLPRDGQVDVALPTPRVLERRSVVLGDDLLVLGCFVDVGNPQFVVVLDSLTELESPLLLDRARAIRWNEEEFPGGTNVNFVVQDGDAWHIRTYERGVEDETLSCGSGVLAAACALVGCPYPEVLEPAATTSGRASRPEMPAPLELRFRTRSGEDHVVAFPEGSQSLRIWARGPVDIVAGGQLWT